MPGVGGGKLLRKLKKRLSVEIHDPSSCVCAFIALKFGVDDDGGGAG